ncbi:MAG: sigma-70 family RNA polymerase sigma factor [Ruminococcaceae bacterium]|nr:sigma-70 family RNA polymerase sigma factor [Oscillospiraceae bacterium]
MEQKELWALLLRVRDGEDEAFALLASRFVGMTEGLVRAFSAGLCEADGRELSQEARLALYRAACTYKPSPDVTFGLYARICVRNALISFLRRRTVPDGISFCNLDGFLLSDEREPLGSLLEEEQLSELLARIVTVLSSYEESVFSLLIEGEKNGKIAEILGKSEKSVSNAVFRIQAKLRALLAH